MAQSKKTFSFTIVLILIVTTVISCTSDTSDNKNNERPNIILIMSDDVGYSDIGSYGSEIRTPNLDNLAQNGVRFSQFYNTARCVPTRGSLLTGLYPAQADLGFMTNDSNQPGYRGDLSDNAVTIAEVLKRAGYSTYMSGKWHVTKQLKDVDSLKYNWPKQRGFDKFYGTIIGAGSYWDPWTLTRGNDFITPLNDPEYQPEDEWYYTDAISDNAVQYIEEHTQANSDNPFFMYVAYTAAHWPLHAPEEAIEQYEGQYDEGFAELRKERMKRLKSMGLIDEEWNLSEREADWDTVANKEWHTRNMQVYAAMLTQMDHGIGNIVDKLKEEGKFENTLVLYLQDNGACAETLSWFDVENAADTLASKPVYDPMAPDELQKRMIPRQNREGYPVAVQSKKVMAGSDQTYHAYGPMWSNVSNTPFRKHKHWIHEGGIATPLIAHWPSKIDDEGAIRHQPGHLIDIMPTLLDVADADYPETYKGNQIKPMEGKSLVDVITDNEKIEREAIYFEHEGNRGLRKGKWKLVSKAYPNAGKFRRVDTLAIDQWALYNMEKDRTETNNLADEKPEFVKELADMWYKWAIRTNTIPKPK